MTKELSFRAPRGALTSLLTLSLRKKLICVFPDYFSFSHFFRQFLLLLVIRLSSLKSAQCALWRLIRFLAMSLTYLLNFLKIINVLFYRYYRNLNLSKSLPWKYTSLKLYYHYHRGIFKRCIWNTEKHRWWSFFAKILKIVTFILTLTIFAKKLLHQRFSLGS